jgi:hypothetical protein
MESIGLVTTLLSFLGLGIMVYNLWMVISTRQTLPGGVIGARWNTLFWLVLFFAIGYLVTPFSSMLTEEMLRIVVGFIFLFGAVYVAVTIHLIRRIIRELTS